MFYNNRKIIYTTLIIIAIVLSFLAGKNIGTGTIKSSNKATQTTVENGNYDETMSVNGDKYSMNYSITNALFLDKQTMVFNVDIQNNSNCQTIKVVAKDQDNNTLDVEPNITNNKNALQYTVKVDTSTTKVNIFVYPLTKDMANNKNLNLGSTPFQSSKLDIGLIKKEQIETLQD